MNDVLTELDPIGDYALVRLQGEIDLSNAADLRDALFDCVPGTAAGLILDLEKLRYIDSAGIRVVFELVRHLDNRRQTLAISIPRGSPLRKLLHVAGIEQALEVHETPEACERSLHTAAGAQSG